MIARPIGKAGQNTMRVAEAVEEIARRVPLLRRPFYQRDVARGERDALAVRLQAMAPPPSPAETTLQGFDDIRGELRCLDDWRAFVEQNPGVLDRKHIELTVAHGVKTGVTSRFLGDIPPEEIVAHGTNYRESYLARGFNARQRAMLDEMHDIIGNRSIYDVSIYAHEAMTPLALTLRGRYPRFLGSEYAPDANDRQRIFPIPSIDITASGLPDESFDIVLSGDVLEHVPDLPAALCDTARILKPGGQLIASFPVAYGDEQTVIKARLSDGKIDYLMPPEYHGNPMDASGGSLVFQIPAWDIIDDARRAGFSDASLVFLSSARRGIAGDADLGAIILFVARR
jgi:hypothetical protein